jgi:hypothetical protein
MVGVHACLSGVAVVIKSGEGFGLGRVCGGAGRDRKEKRKE